MKFPTLFRTAAPMRFDIKPRYYDPVREELEERTSQIKRDLQQEGKLPYDGTESEDYRRYGASFKGAFTSGSQIKGRQSSPLTSAGMIRLVIFVLLVGVIFGYIYLGPDAIYIMGYGLAVIGLVVLFFRFKGKSRT